MQSTGQTSTQAASLVSMQGSVMMKGMLEVSVSSKSRIRYYGWLRPDPMGCLCRAEPTDYTARIRAGKQGEYGRRWNIGENGRETVIALAAHRRVLRGPERL